MARRSSSDQKRATGWSRATRSRPLLLEPLEPRLLLSSLPIISEFLASNKAGLKDSFGETSDWLEIYNPDSQQAVDLTHWKLKCGKNTIWEFPDDLTLGPGEFRVIFASGRDLKDLNGELHTNFNLDKDGANLRLLDVGDNVVYSYTPYPEQQADISYGAGQQVTETKLVAAGAAARYYVPNNGSLGLSWTQPRPIFDDSYWAGAPTGVPTGIGFANLGPGFAVTIYKSSMTGTIGNLATAQSIVDNPANQSWVRTETAPVINYLNKGSSGHFTSDRTVPGMTIGTEVDNYVIRATGVVHIPSAGAWTFGVNSDDGFRLTVGAQSFQYDGGRGASDSLRTYTFTAAGDYDLELLHFQGTGDSEVEVFAVQGSYTSWSGTANWRLVGDTPNGGLAIASSPFPGPGNSPAFAGQIRTDVGAAMQGKSSLYMRVNFDVDPTVLASLQTLTLKMAYDDGYVAYLNGVEVARRNAPTTVTWNSRATEERPSDVQATTFEIIDLTSCLGLLTAQNNVLAIQVLNMSTSDRAVGGITRDGPTATVTLADHGFANGDVVHIAGAGQSEYNGDFVISNVTQDTFTYTVPGTPASPATGMITARRVDGDMLIVPELSQIVSTQLGLHYFAVPTPGAANSQEYWQKTADPKFSGAHGFYEQPIQLTLSTDTAGSHIYYTLDSSDPWAPSLAASAGITRSGATATTTLNGHGFANGNLVLISGAVQPEYNGVFAIGNVTANTFTYTVSGTPASPATGAITVYRLDKAVTALTRDGATARVTAADHGFLSGDRIRIAGASQPEYNGDFVISVVDADTFTYAISGAPASPATGTIGAIRLAQQYANPITISTTTTVRAVAYNSIYEPSSVVTETYIFLDDVIEQPANPSGFPSSWDTWPADYQMDPRITTDPAYKNVLKEALLSIPTMSIVTDKNNLFDRTNGIYANTSISLNANYNGPAMVVPGSLEYFQPDGSGSFQVNAGVQIYGGVGRQPQYKKHSFRLVFQSQYGPTTLNFPLFGAGAVTQFDTLILRSEFNDAWVWAGSNVQFIRDAFAADTQLAMGDPSHHSTWVHLYVDGLYWGLYQVTERPDSSFAASYMGGDKEDWEANNAGGAIDGLPGVPAWTDMMSKTNFGLTTTTYQAGSAGFNSTCYRANVAVASLADAQSVIDTPSKQISQTTQTVGKINYFNTGAGGHFSSDSNFPGMSSTEVDNFVVDVRATVEIPTTGNWTFGVSSNDGFSLTLTQGSTVFASSLDGTRTAPADTFKTFNITSPGAYDLRLLYFQNTAGAEVELFAASGSYTAWGGTTNWKLVGDTSGGLLALSSVITVANLQDAQSVIDTPAKQVWKKSQNDQMVNYKANGADGHFASSAAFPNNTAVVENFVVEVNGTISIPTAGSWTFGVSSDDGFSATLYDGADPLPTADGSPLSFAGAGVVTDTLKTFNIPRPGAYRLRLVYFQNTAGAELELFAAPGTWTSWGDTTSWRLVWNVASGGLGANYADMFTATSYQANVTVASLTDAQSVIDTPAKQVWTNTQMAGPVNFLNTGADVHYGGNIAFPGTTIGQLVENLVVQAQGAVYIPATGSWTFGVSCDDGFRLQLFDGASQLSPTLEHSGVGGAADYLQTYNIAHVGVYGLKLLYYQNTGGAELELFAAQGSKSAFDTGFKLVGDTAGGGLTAGSGIYNADMYYRLQGENPDGTPNPSYPVLLDVNNYIDYMLMNFFIGNADWPGHNFYAARPNDPGSTGYKFFDWDAEWSIGINSDLFKNMTGVNTNAAKPYYYLCGVPEFRMRFADRAQKFLFNGGVLTPEATIPRYQALADEVQWAVIPESARWGDVPTAPAPTPHTAAEWRNQRDWALNTYLPQRTGIVIQQLRDAGLYPGIDAPAFLVNGTPEYGGTFNPGDTLAVSAAGGEIWYTIDGSDPRLPGGARNSAAVRYTDPLTLHQTVQIKARVYLNGTWSALADASFYANLAPAIRITELMYDPAPPSEAEIAAGFADNEDFEYIEIKNIGSQTLPLAGLRISNGVDFTFLDGSLEPNHYLVVPADPLAFHFRYPGVTNYVSSGWQGHLDNAGEKIELDAPIGGIIHEFTYKDGWYAQTDGAGFSLTVRDPLQPLSSWDSSDGWRSSAAPGGTPGYDDTLPTPGSIIVNEVLSHTSTPTGDMIELYNTTDQPISVGGWFVSDSGTNLTKYEIAAGTTIAGHGYLVLTEAAHFGNTGDPLHCHTAFALNEHGDDVYLSSNVPGLPGVVGGYREHVDFGGAFNGVSTGLYTKSTGGTDFTLLQTPTFGPGPNYPGAPNSIPYIAPLVFNEVMYHPADPTPAEISAGFLNNDDFEFIELYNRSGTSLSLRNFYVGDGVGFTFGWYGDGIGSEVWTLEPGATATWTADNLQNATYHVYAHYTLLDGDNKTRTLDDAAQYTIAAAGGPATVTVDQNTAPGTDGWVDLGSYAFNTSGAVTLTRGLTGPNNSTIADQVKFTTAGQADVVLGNPTLDSFATRSGMTTLAPGAYLVLVSNYAAFDTRYHIAANHIPVAGAYSGNLDNNGEMIRLYQAGNLDPGVIPQYEIDHVSYSDHGSWPSEPDGSGSALIRVHPAAYGNDAINWQAGALGGTPGQANIPIDRSAPSRPGNVVALVTVNPGPTRITLTWDASHDNESFVDHYVVYRDGQVFGTPLTTSYADTDVQPAAPHMYEVTAVNRDGYEGGRSAAIVVSVPGVASCRVPDDTHIELNFTEALHAATAGVLGNYSLAGVALNSVALSRNNTKVILTTAARLVSGNSYTLTINGLNTTQSGNQVPDGLQVSFTFVPQGSGYILRQYWTNLGSGTNVSDLINDTNNFNNTPAGRTYLTSLEAPTSFGTNYGTRLRGYLYAPTTGSYTFWIASDDSSELWLSTDENPANKGTQPIAYVTGSTTARQWTKYTSQQSAAIALTAGQRYYVEILHKQGGGGDNLAVRWQLPGGAWETSDQNAPIPGIRLQPYGELPDATPPAVPQNLTARIINNNTQVSLSWRPSADGESSVDHYVIYRDGIVYGTPATAAFIDTSVSPAVRHRYQVSAVNPDGFESALSPAINVVPLGIASAVCYSATAVQLSFTEPLDRATAEQPANYALDNGATVLSARLEGDNLTVTLTTSPLRFNSTYTATVNRPGVVNGVRTFSGELLPENTQQSFSYGGSILREYWLGIGSGTSVTDLTVNPNFPNFPTGREYRTLFEAPANATTNSAERMRGYVYPSVTGDYYFYIASDDNSQLWLSTDENPANKVLIASVTGSTSSRQWNKYASQKSPAVHLEAGQRYYIEALQKQGGSSENLAVAWQRPDATPVATLGPNQSVTSIDRTATTTATVTVPSHGFVTGQVVYISGAGQPEYNGSFVIAVVNSNTFTYTPTSWPSKSVTDLRRSGTTATATTAVDHGFTNGKKVYVSGADQSQYNGLVTISVGADPKKFTYTVSSSAPTPATGTISATPSATGTIYAQAYGISRSGSTAIVELPNHGFANGDWIAISGADQVEYNGVFSISSVTTNTFKYTISGTPASPATGTLSAFKVLPIPGNYLAPAAPFVGALPLSATVNALSTSAATPALSGSVSDFSAPVTVNLNGVYYAAVNNGNNTWMLADNVIQPALADGIYQVTVCVADSYGRVGFDTTSNDLLVDTVAPTVGISDVTPNPRTSAVPQLQIDFSEPVTGFDLADLSLTCNDGPDLITGAESLTTADNVHWTLGGLTGLNSSAGVYQLTVKALGANIADAGGNPLANGAARTWTIYATVTGRRVFYNNSAFDANNAAATPEDDNAIAPDKSALLPGTKASFANYTSYSRGINGIMVDISRLGNPTTLSAADFQFNVGNSNDLNTWTPAAAPTTVAVRSLGNDLSRVTLIWPDNAIQKQWLQVIVLAGGSTGLPAADVFYFGNALGECGNDPTSAVVNLQDDLAARGHKTGFTAATITNPYDFNRDRRVNATDELVARNNHTDVNNCLKLIDLSGGGHLPGVTVAPTIAPRTPNVGAAVVRLPLSGYGSATAAPTACDAVLAAPVGQKSSGMETWSPQWAWLCEIEQVTPKKQAKKGNAALDALDKVLAAY